MQLVVRIASVEPLYVALGSIADEAEIFPITDSTVGVSIPTKVIDVVGEKEILFRLATFEYFDLWSGAWKRPSFKPTVGRRT
ncbi:hypothetical protein Q3O97_05670 [Ralstonia pseudosolanacearum]|uniref:hypothetical protein n=1 Tax=Ralstonia pseudosolanacearum TaxID=1310165 RepID=UPI00270B4D6C|nr:hypothetical protein [Ralstonia pseudosolanacearum]MDO3615326.1 hypothetical protein [Ralstonia pseudosolanacearum]